jgi:hypothetical protein
VARGATAGALCALLSVSGHLAAGGGRPDLGLLAVLGLLLTGSLIALADRRRGRLEILAVVAGSQVVLHTLLELLGSHAGHAVADPGGMTLVHAVATVVAATVLAGAEDAVFRLAGALHRALPDPLPPPLPPAAAGAPAHPVTPAPAGRRRGALDPRTHTRRGPPPTALLPRHP